MTDDENLTWADAGHFQIIENDILEVERAEIETHGTHGRNYLVITEADITALRSGKLLFHGDEYSYVIKFEGQANDL